MGELFFKYAFKTGLELATLRFFRSLNNSVLRIHAHETPGVLALKDQDTVRREGGERLIPNIMIYSHLPFYLSPPHR